MSGSKTHELEAPTKPSQFTASMHHQHPTMHVKQNKSFHLLIKINAKVQAIFFVAIMKA